MDAIPCGGVEQVVARVPHERFDQEHAFSEGRGGHEGFVDDDGGVDVH